MPDWEALLGDLTAVQFVVWFVAAVLVIALLVKLWPFIKNAVAIVDALTQLPAMKKQIDGIHHETHTNDGSSIKDAAARIEAGVAGLHGRMDAVEADVKALRAADAELRADLENTQPKEKP